MPYDDQRDNRALTRPTDPQPTCATANNAVWYRYTALASRDITIDSSESDHDTVIAVFAGEPGRLLQITCEDNGSDPAQLTFTATTGIAYYIMIAGQDGTSGEINVDVAFAPLPATVPPTDTATQPPSAAGLGAPLYGPGGGSLEHSDDGFVETFNAGVEVVDFIVTATFENPYALNTGSWDFGFLLRNEGGNNQFRLIIESDRGWAFINQNEDEEDRRGSGNVTSLDTSPGGSNAVTVIGIGDWGAFFVNDEFVATLDMSGRITAADITLATNIVRGNAVEGAFTRFSNFAVYEPSPAFGPADGQLLHEEDGFIEVVVADVDVRDFVVEADFSVPYARSLGSWDIGFLLRHDAVNDQIRLIVDSNGSYRILNSVDGEYTNIVEGNTSALNIRTGETNNLRVIFYGTIGVLFINDELIETFDLSLRTNSGDIRIGTGISSGNEINGSTTAYSGFTIYELPPPVPVAPGGNVGGQPPLITPTVAGGITCNARIGSGSGAANIRSGPSTEFGILYALSDGEAVVINGLARGEDNFTWWRLTGGGWIRADLVDNDSACFNLVPRVDP